MAQNQSQSSMFTTLRAAHISVHSSETKCLLMLLQRHLHQIIIAHLFECRTCPFCTLTHAASRQKKLWTDCALFRQAYFPTSTAK